MEALEKKDPVAVDAILLCHWGKGFLGEEEPGQDIPAGR
jgi:hypothetical protein